MAGISCAGSAVVAQAQRNAMAVAAPKDPMP